MLKLTHNGTVMLYMIIIILCIVVIFQDFPLKNKFMDKIGKVLLLIIFISSCLLGYREMYLSVKYGEVSSSSSTANKIISIKIGEAVDNMINYIAK
jgi:hypothetical protein